MGKMIKKIKTTFSTISWPSAKHVLVDTVVTVLVTAILSVLILGWTTGIEFVVDWVVALF